MFPVLETPIFITLIIMLYVLFFFVLFLTKSREPKEKQQVSAKTLREASEESRSECTMFGFLQKLPKGDPIPDECLSCQKLVECLMRKKAYDWYSGQNSSDKNET